jgi:hypothetical protein
VSGLPILAEDVMIRSEVMVRQADALAGDLRELTGGYDQKVSVVPDMRGGPRRAHRLRRLALRRTAPPAPRSLAFETLADLDCEAALPDLGVPNPGGRGTGRPAGPAGEPLRPSGSQAARNVSKLTGVEPL